MADVLGRLPLEADGEHAVGAAFLSDFLSLIAPLQLLVLNKDTQLRLITIVMADLQLHLCVDSIRFEWDEAKNLINQSKHGLSFEEAASVFLDPSQVSVQDRIEDGEERWQTFGMVRGVLLVMVAHTVREEEHAETVIRIISARRADRKERRFYEDENG